MKSILIFGVSGFIGGNFAEFFLRKGLRVTGLDVQSSEKTESLLNSEKFAFIQGEWQNSVRELVVSDYDTILFLASPSTVSVVEDNPVDSFSSMCMDVIVLLEMLVVSNPTAKVIFPSSAAVYGEVNSINANEDLPLLPVSLYGVFKKNVEDIARHYSRRYGLSITMIRFFSVYGPGLQKQLFWDAIVKAKAPSKEVRFSGSGQEVRDWIYISDAIELTYLILIKMFDNPSRFSIVNGGTGVATSVKTALDFLITNLISDKSAVFTGSHRQDDPSSLVADIRLANSYGWSSEVSIEEGLGKYLNWYKDQNL